jgi:transcriptional regulator with XRE-family HTH domain
MTLGKRLRTLRLQKKLSPREIERRSGLLRPYLSRVENDHTQPTVGTLMRLAGALEVPLYRLFFNGHRPARPAVNGNGRGTWASPRDEARYLSQLCRLLRRMKEPHRELLFSTAQRMARKHSHAWRLPGKRHRGSANS